MAWTDLLPDGVTGATGVPDDHRAMVDLIAACELATTGDTWINLDAFETELGEHDFDPVNDAVYVMSESGDLVAGAQFRCRAPYVHSWTEAWVHPDHVGRGIGSAIVAWATDLARGRVDRAPEGTRVVMAMGANERNDRARRLLTAKGFEVSRYYLEMEIELDDAVSVTPPPAGITVRTLGADEPVDSLARAVAESFRDHHGYTESPMEDRIARWKQWRTSDMWDDSLVWLAMDGDDIAGVNVALRYNGAKEHQGYVATLGVLKPWRGRGLARSLLTTSFDEYRRRGMTSVSLHVDADSITGATRLYTGVGMAEVQREIDYEQELRAGKDIVVR
jgi:mycothiol synthase